MKFTQKGIDLIHRHESLRLNAYLCPAGLPTIGYGNTFYEDGTRVKLGEKITKKRAEELFNSVVQNNFIEPVKRLLKVTLNDNQFSALVSFAYNVGIGNFQKSTLLRIVNTNPNDERIAHEFKRWNKSNGRVLNGLIRRRNDEAKLYFS